MNEKERTKLESLYPQWLDETIQRISPFSTLDGNLQDQLEAFYQLLIHEPFDSMVEPVKKLFSNWYTLIHNEHQDAMTDTLLVRFVAEITEATANICHTHLKDRDAFNYFQQLLPFLLRCTTLAHETELNAITGTKKTEIKPSEDLTTKLNALQSEFFQLTSETLVTPVTLIEGYATMIETQAEGLPEKNDELITLIQGLKNGIERLSNLVNEMAYLALIDQRRLDISKQPISINQFLQKLERDFQPIMNRRKLSMSFQINNTDQMINTDVDKMLYAIKILIHYAINTTPENGSIEIITDTIQDKLQVQIIDNGYGLTQQQKSELFNKLKKADSSVQAVKRFSNISGNGMYIAKGIIQTHLGSLWIDSPIFDNIDQAGKRFNILLPIR
jgi:signal transduction histidine kinase